MAGHGPRRSLTPDYAAPELEARQLAPSPTFRGEGRRAWDVLPLFGLVLGRFAFFGRSVLQGDLPLVCLGLQGDLPLVWLGLQGDLQGDLHFLVGFTGRFVGCETVAVVVCFLFWGGRGASQLPGGEGGRGAGQLWGWV